MKQDSLDTWLQNFEREMADVQVEFDAFFKEKKISAFFEIKADREKGFFSIELKNREGLPTEIIDRITVAYLESKPK